MRMKNLYSQISSQYKAIELQTRIETASPHELIDLLLQGARSHIATAQGNIQRNQIKEKGEHISKAISIIEGLKMSLNHDKGGEIAENLLQLYDYVQQILLKANLKNDEDLLAQSNMLLAEVHQAWQAINSNAGNEL
ncbi:TPA: flagellar export chaperone FliS [Legionella pneumophila]|uniref:Flagellar secretion chaperone FliS n=1 Tax=Legionella pneumophila subsp. pneumophila TaxID=91891 RepID=A0A3A6UAN7_LEGPN|nr:flagellar export chaperone FliS [Legionella pneumophila]ERH42318.1 flagellar biosynthesis protein FliS [Legionella pneumophila str. Leg01/11]ERH44313.1 flagellar biosynthesis protein FliS [Legionella pneumophila str. Leg01/53]ERI47656.1 flagellar biosynthesis protein FliS [Legionella pneumophila str. Leg01/20]ERB42734.1 flagellar biosynthesis protein FliS [Legionella pneumophila str. 121004]MCW8391561.1 flagellar export chaperone FliS [Legionella pneumophila]